MGIVASPPLSELSLRASWLVLSRVQDERVDCLNLAEHFAIVIAVLNFRVV